MTKWQDAWEMYFGKIESHLAWEREITETISPEPSNDDILQAVRALTRNTEVKRPTLRHLKSAILANRAENQAHGYTENDGCSYCTDGWTTYMQERGPYKDMGISLPCLCKRGRKWLMDKYDKAQHDDMRQWAERTHSQIDGKRKADAVMIAAPVDDAEGYLEEF